MERLKEVSSEKDKRRHTVSHDLTEEEAPVELRDWWLPYFYQQAPLLLQPTSKKKSGKKKAAQEKKSIFNAEMPGTPRYGFSGRSRERLQRFADLENV